MKISLKLRSRTSGLLSMFFLLGSITFLPVHVSASTPEQEVADGLFGQMDLNVAGLEQVKSFYNQGMYPDSLNAYRDFFVEKIASMDLGEPINNGAANIQEVYNGGVNASVVFTAREELANGSYIDHTQNLGAPGNMIWTLDYPAYRSYSSVVSSMNWPTLLVNEFISANQKSYLEKWSAIWEDYMINSYDDWLAVKNDPVLKTRINDSGVVWFQRLWLANKGNAFLQQLNKAARYSESLAKQSITGLQLGRILTVLVEKDYDYLITILDSGAPNQVGEAYLALIRAYVSMGEFDNSSEWCTIAKDGLLNIYRQIPGGSVMPDYSDMEQSFNYNTFVMHITEDLETLFSHIEPQPEFVALVREQSARSYRFLSSLVTPTEHMPGLDKMDYRNAYYDWVMGDYETYFQDEETVQRIFDHIFRDGTGPEPAFTSIYYPYGGYSIFRTGWDHDDQFMFMNSSRRGRGHFDESGNSIQLTAYGRDLLIDSGPDSYLTSEAWMPYNLYHRNSTGHNTILVDGKSQYMGGQPEVDIPYVEPLNSRWHTSDRYDFTEGTFDLGYADGLRDVSHDRQVLFEKQSGLYIVIDRMNAEGNHTYNQLWHFSEELESDQLVIDSEGTRLYTNDTDGPNIAMYQFTPASLAYTSYFGSTDPIRGWYHPRHYLAEEGALEADVQWSGTGNQLIVTAILPMPDTASELTSISRIADDDNGTLEGFDSVKEDGTEVKVRVSDNKNRSMTIDGIEVTGELFVLTTAPDETESGVVMGATSLKINGISQAVPSADFEFVRDGTSLSEIKPIRVPSGFGWEQTGSGFVPGYEKKWYSKANEYQALHDWHDNGMEISGRVNVEFDVTPLEQGIDAVIGYGGSSPKDAFSFNGTNIRLRLHNGVFEANDGSSYEKENSVAYIQDGSYHVRISMNTATGYYDAYVTPPGGSEVQIADSYAFDAALTPMDNVGKVYVKSSSDNEVLVTDHIISYTPIKVYVSDLAFDRWSGRTKPIKDKNYSQSPLEMGGVVYAKGLGHHASSDVVYDLTKLSWPLSVFTSFIGVDDSRGANGSVVFRVYADENLLYDSGKMTGQSPTQFIAVDISEASELRLEVSDAGDGVNNDHANWGDAAFYPAVEPVHVSDLDVMRWSGVQPPVKNADLFGGALDINGAVYEKGLGTQAISDATFDISKDSYQRFSSYIGVDEAAGTEGTVVFSVYVDDVLKARSTIMKGGMNAKYLEIDVSGGSELRLVTTDAGDGTAGDYATWGEPKLSFDPYRPGSANIPHSLNLSELEWASWSGGAAPSRDKDNTGGTLVIDGTTYETGLGVQAPSEIVFDLTGNRFSRFQSWIGVDDGAGTLGTVTFSVYADDVLKFRSDTMTGSSPALLVDTDISGAGSLRLVVEDSGDGTLFDLANWAEAQLYNPVYLSDLPWESWSGYEMPKINTSRSRGPVTIGGTVYAKGLGMHAVSSVTYDLSEGNYSRFRSDIGVDDAVGSNGSVVFKLYADSELIYQSGTMTGDMQAQLVDVDITGTNQLTLEVGDAGNGNNSDHADWANARLIR